MLDKMFGSDQYMFGKVKEQAPSQWILDVVIEIIDIRVQIVYLNLKAVRSQTKQNIFF